MCELRRRGARDGAVGLPRDRAKPGASECPLPGLSDDGGAADDPQASSTARRPRLPADTRFDHTCGAMIPHEIVFAAATGDIEAMRRWLESGTRDLNEHYGVNRGTLLHRSLIRYDIPGSRQRDNFEMLTLLMANGADHDREDDCGFTPLFFCKYTEEVRVLLDARADIEHRAWDYSNRTPLFGNYNTKVTRVLLSRGADVSAVDEDGRDAEAFARFQAENLFSGLEQSEIAQKVAIADLIADVKRAGGWRRYANEPRIELVRLRTLYERGRASLRRSTRRTAASHSILQRLFGAPLTSTALNKTARVASPIPKEVFWHVLQFWRTSRDV